MNIDVVIVGGGIGGASLATALARSGCSVVVLEATERFTDRVRGESMMPWGVAEAEVLGVADVLRRAGGHTAAVWNRYSEGATEAREIPVGLVVPDVGGTLNLHHPVACQALLDAAAAAGAEVVRGVRSARLTGHSSVSYDLAGSTHTVSARVVVGADGRSSMIRDQAGITLDRTDATAVIAGLFVEGVDETDDDVVAETDLGMALLINQAGDRARAYHVIPIGDRARYSGGPGSGLLLDDLRSSSAELERRLVAARPAGPCAAFPNVETWTDEPARGSVVLIGDAAGQSDPSIGCGLSITMRDARTVHDVIVTGASGPKRFTEYARQRADLLRRLRLIASLMISAVVTPGADRSDRRHRLDEAMAAMDPTVFPIVFGTFAGPETIPEEMLERGIPELLQPMAIGVP